jgi:hypothetical protein
MIERIEDIDTGELDNDQIDVAEDNIDQIELIVYVGNLDNMQSCPYVRVCKLLDGRYMVEYDDPNIRIVELLEEVNVAEIEVYINDTLDQYEYHDIEAEIEVKREDPLFVDDSGKYVKIEKF